MMKHTPGPWAVTPRTNKRGQRLAPAITAPRNGARGFALAILSFLGGQEGEANACLIAASPELLGMLRKLIVAVDGAPAARAVVGAVASEAALAVCKAEGSTTFAEELVDHARAEGRQ